VHFHGAKGGPFQGRKQPRGETIASDLQPAFAGQALAQARSRLALAAPHDACGQAQAQDFGGKVRGGGGYVVADVGNDVLSLI
jgi:hypothetical protein